MNEIVIVAGDARVRAELNDRPTARQVWDALPIEGTASLWGDEVYFRIPVIASQEPDAQVEVEIGTLGYWPVGHAFCVFFGPTPVSRGEKPRAYSPVNILGRVTGDAKAFRSVSDGMLVRVERVEQA